MRLSEKLSSTNRAWGVPAAANRWAFFAINWTWLPILRNTARRAPPIWLP
ncbi:MAG: hypothetical protein IPH30_04120 [Betaproteobacteria bacterium]|nr:hypothetical protein [Betaproteobacteria bacterium]